jgi:cilia- and flagella-associated protein 251
VLWDIKSGSSSFIEKYALKVIEVHRKSAINYLACIGKYIVTGSEDGYVRFFDHKLRLDAWFEEFNAGPIISISFEKPANEPPATMISSNESTDSRSQTEASRMESRASRSSHTATSIAKPPGADQDEMSEDGTTSTGDSKDFKCPNFVVGTRTAVIVHVESSAFLTYDPEKLRGKVIVQGQSGPVQSLACHPEKPYLAISGFSGYIHIWNYLTRNLITFIRMNGLYVSAMQFDSKGSFMAVGCTNGVIKVFEAGSFKEV